MESLNKKNEGLKIKKGVTHKNAKHFKNKNKASLCIKGFNI